MAHCLAGTGWEPQRWEQSVCEKQPQTPQVFQQQPAAPAFPGDTIPPVGSMVAYCLSKQQQVPASA